MSNFFSGIIMKDKTVLTDLKNNSHEGIIEKYNLNDRLSADHPARDWVRFKLIPRKFFSTKEKDWAFVIDESIIPEWVAPAHEVACRQYLKENLFNQKWFKRTKKEVERIEKIQWFKPMDEPKIEELFPKAQELGKAFKIEGEIKVKIIRLPSESVYSAAWSAAESAAESAARSAAWSAARSAAESASWSAARSAAESAVFEVSANANKEYKTNPFKLLVNLWEQGFYVYGITDNILTLGYVQK